MRKSITTRYFYSTAILLLCSIALMGFIQLYLSMGYFRTENEATLLQTVDNTILVMQEASDLSDTEKERVEDVTRGIVITSRATGTMIFCADAQGSIILCSATDPSRYLGLNLPAKALGPARSGVYTELGTLNGLLDSRCYVAGKPMLDADGQLQGYVFAASDARALSEYVANLVSTFILSAGLMLMVSSVLSIVLTSRMTTPLRRISDAAKKFGSGDFSARVPVEGEDELAQLAVTFNNMASNLEKIDSSRHSFMGNIAHELRTPMTTIKGFVDGILDGTIPPEMQNHYLQLVSEETGRLARLIQNMLDLSKLESGEYQVNARMFNIWETLTGVALAAEQRINDGMIELEGLTMDEKVLVYADPDLIHQVAYNLLDNAIKFTPAGGTIRFSVEKLGPEAEISIWNSGQGISPEALPYVFERFYKEDRSRGLHARGSGLGLNICKVLVNLAGGQIRVESQQGEWCRFVFTLPTCSPNPGGMKRLPDAAGQPGAVEEPASMKPVE